MLILIWFIVCILFAFVHYFLGTSGHALELFALLSAISLFSKIEGDEDTIMGLPVKQIKEYLNTIK